MRILDSASVEFLYRHPWPGNVRELENLVHRQYLLAEGGPLHLPGAAPVATGRVPFERGFRAARALAIEGFEREFVAWALTEAKGNVSLAARRAGKERRAFGKLMKKHGIDRAGYLAS